MLVDKEYFISLAGRHGLTLRDTPGRLCGQELVVLENAQSRPVRPAACVTAASAGGRFQKYHRISLSAQYR
jgi:hypothetical protein